MVRSHLRVAAPVSPRLQGRSQYLCRLQGRISFWSVAAFVSRTTAPPRLGLRPRGAVRPALRLPACRKPVEGWGKRVEAPRRSRRGYCRSHAKEARSVFHLVSGGDARQQNAACAHSTGSWRLALWFSSAAVTEFLGSYGAACIRPGSCIVPVRSHHGPTHHFGGRRIEVAHGITRNAG
jgi:hypothetical protein